MSFPLRYTFVDNLLLSSNNLSNALLEPYSLIEEINDAKKIAITIPSVSYQSKFLNKKTILIESAIKSIFIIGSDNYSNSILKNVLLFFLVISLLPYFFLNSKTSLSFSPKVKYLHLSILKKLNIMTILHILYIFKKVCYN